MKHFSGFIFILSFIFLVACSLGEQIHNASDLQPDQLLGGLTIKEVRKSEDGFLLFFKDTLLLEGTAVNSPVGDYGITSQVLGEKIKLNENIIDLALTDVLYFKNYKEMPRYFDGSMYQDIPNGKVLKENLAVRVKVAGLEVNTNARDLVSGEVVEVLSINGESVNYEDGETASNETLQFEELKVGQEVDGVTIAEHELVPDDYFGLSFSGEFTTTGDLYYDDMWSELTFAANDGEPLNRRIEVTGLPVQMMSYVKFRNKQDVRAALGEEKIRIIESGQRIPVTMVVRDFSVSGAFYSEYGSMFDFVSFVE